MFLSIGRRHFRILRSMCLNLDITLVRSGKNPRHGPIWIFSKPTANLLVKIFFYQHLPIYCSIFFYNLLTCKFHVPHALEWVKEGKSVLITKYLLSRNLWSFRVSIFSKISKCYCSCWVCFAIRFGRPFI